MPNEVSVAIGPENETLSVRKQILNNATDSRGKTLLSIAAENQNPNIFEHLVKCGATQPNGSQELSIYLKDATTKFLATGKDKDLDLIKLLLRGGAKGEDTLNRAVNNGNVKLINVLAKNGTNINHSFYTEGDYGAPDTEKTALHIAACAFPYDSRRMMVGALLKAGADPNTTNQNSETPLHIAVKWGDIKTVEMLIKHGANVHATDSEGKTPAHIAASDRNLIKSPYTTKENLEQAKGLATKILAALIKKGGEDILFEKADNSLTPYSTLTIRTHDINFAEGIIRPAIKMARESITKDARDDAIGRFSEADPEIKKRGSDFAKEAAKKGETWAERRKNERPSEWIR